MLDVVIVTADDVEFDSVKKVLMKKFGCKFSPFQIKKSETATKVPLFGGTSTQLKFSDNSNSQYNVQVGLFKLLERGGVGVSQFLEAVRVGVKETNQVSKRGCLVMAGICAGNPDTVQMGSVMTPPSISRESTESDDNTPWISPDSKIKLKLDVRAAIGAAHPRNDANEYEWLDKYLPEEYKSTPSPLHLQDAILDKLNRVCYKPMSVTEIADYIVQLHQWSSEGISFCNKMVKETLRTLEKCESVSKITFRIGEDKYILKSLPNLPQSNPELPKVKVIDRQMKLEDFARVGSTFDDWTKRKRNLRLGTGKTTDADEMEGYEFLRFTDKHLDMLNVWFVKVVTSYATEKSTLKYYEEYGSCLATAFLLKVLETNAELIFAVENNQHELRLCQQ
ncbi:uncharacterized protein LOC134176781 [Corticium candelabrum]|uniref:uncharacterized protein LOC134176781 n=1 Tax=Corticium candelabrum TaxID=121492 RepID=UPI002E25857A|nr:uncharacterized protein LOC134176781 [Corticium candelabrum]